MSNATRDYFAHRLRALGYEPTEDRRGEPEIYFDLGYGQSSHVTFSARVTDAAAARLLSGASLAAARRAFGKDADRPAVRSRRASASVDYPAVVQPETEREVADGWLTEREGAAMTELTDEISDELFDVARTLRREGYAFQEAMNPTWFDLDADDEEHGYDERAGAYVRTLRQYRTPRFVVVVDLVEPRHFSPFESGDTARDMADAERMIAGETVAYECRATVYGRDEDGDRADRLARVYGYETTDDAPTGDPTPHMREAALDAAREAIAEARATLTRLSGGIKAAA